MLIITINLIFRSTKRTCSEFTGALCHQGKWHQAGTGNNQKKPERMPRGISNNMCRLNMHLEKQIRRAKYINPNPKVTLSQAEKSSSTSERRGQILTALASRQEARGSVQALKS